MPSTVQQKINSRIHVRKGNLYIIIIIVSVHSDVRAKFIPRKIRVLMQGQSLQTKLQISGLGG
jgi:hypothetical protein